MYFENTPEVVLWKRARNVPKISQVCLLYFLVAFFYGGGGYDIAFDLCVKDEVRE